MAPLFATALILTGPQGTVDGSIDHAPSTSSRQRRQTRGEENLEQEILPGGCSGML